MNKRRLVRCVSYFSWIFYFCFFSVSFLSLRSVRIIKINVVVFFSSKNFSRLPPYCFFRFSFSSYCSVCKKRQIMRRKLLGQLFQHRSVRIDRDGGGIRRGSRRRGISKSGKSRSRSCRGRYAGTAKYGRRAWKKEVEKRKRNTGKGV